MEFWHGRKILTLIWTFIDMLKRLLFSTLLNIGIIVLLYFGFIAFNQAEYGVLVGAILLVIVLIYLKIKILKQVKDMKKQ